MVQNKGHRHIVVLLIEAATQFIVDSLACYLLWVPTFLMPVVNVLFLRALVRDSRSIQKHLKHRRI